MESGAANKACGEVCNPYLNMHKRIILGLDGKLIEGLVDDREIGAERIFSKQMEEKGYKNTACAVTS